MISLTAVVQFNYHIVLTKKDDVSFGQATDKFIIQDVNQFSVCSFHIVTFHIVIDALMKLRRSFNKTNTFVHYRVKS